MFRTLKYTALAAWYKLTGTRPYVTIIASGRPGCGKTIFLNSLSNRLGMDNLKVARYEELPFGRKRAPMSLWLRMGTQVLLTEDLNGSELTIKLIGPHGYLTGDIISLCRLVANGGWAYHREQITTTASQVEMSLIGFIRHQPPETPYPQPTDDDLPWNDPQLSGPTLKKLKRLNRMGRLWITSRQMQTAWKPLEIEDLIKKARGRNNYGEIRPYYALTAHGRRRLKAATQ